MLFRSLTLAGEGSLDYEGNAKVAAGQNAMTSLIAGFSGASFIDGKLSFPFTLQGTPQHPIFRLKSKPGMRGFSNPPTAPSAAEHPPGQPDQKPADIVRSIQQLFKKRKQ